MREEVTRVLAAGYTVIADATFVDPDERQVMEDLAAELEVPFTGFWLEAPVDIMRERVETRQRNPSDATAKVLERQIKTDIGSITWNRIDSSGPREQTIAAVAEILGIETGE